MKSVMHSTIENKQIMFFDLDWQLLVYIKSQRDIKKNRVLNII